MRAVIAAVALVLCTGANAATIMPGQWQYTGRVISASIPGAPPSIVDTMKKRPQVTSVCVTPEQAAKGPREMFQQSKGRCNFSKFDMTGGRISLMMICKGQGGAGTMTITSEGSYTPTSYAARSTLRSSGPQTMSMVVEGAGKRVGPCKK
jgi:hypothetical protein